MVKKTRRPPGGARKCGWCPNSTASHLDEYCDKCKSNILEEIAKSKTEIRKSAERGKPNGSPLSGDYEPHVYRFHRNRAGQQ